MFSFSTYQLIKAVNVFKKCSILLAVPFFSILFLPLHLVAVFAVASIVLCVYLVNTNFLRFDHYGVAASKKNEFTETNSVENNNNNIYRCGGSARQGRLQGVLGGQVAFGQQKT